MDYYPLIYVIPNMVAFAIEAWVSYQVYYGKRTQYRTALFVSMLCICLTSLILLAEKLTPDMGLLLLLTAIEYLFVSILLISMAIFLFQYVGMGKYVTTRNLMGLAIVPIITLVAISTNEWHHLYYVTAENAPYGGFYMFSAEHGPLFFLWMAYFLFLMTGMTGLLFKSLSDTPVPRRRGIWSFIIAMLSMLVIDILYILFSRDYPFIDFFSIGYALVAVIIFTSERRSTFLNVEIIGVQEAIVGMKDGIVVLDGSFHMAYANEPGQRILDDNRDVLDAQIMSQQLTIPIGIRNIEMRLTVGGTDHHFSITSSDIVRDDVAIGAVLVFHDISNRKAMEEDIVSINRRLTTLNQVIRHDIRNDVVSFWSYLELLEGTDLDPRQKELVTKLLERVRSTDRYLNLARDMASIGTAKPIWHDMDDILAQTMEQVDTGSIKVVRGPIGMKVLADPLLPNVFHSLADNTVRHGTSATTVNVRAETSQNGLVIIWEDDGVGVPAEDKERIFQRGHGKNTGLGLFLSREILSMTGGTITEEGTPGRGARFVIRIPSGSFAPSG